MKGASLDDLHEQWLQQRPGYKEAYEGLEEEFSLAAAMIETGSNIAEKSSEVTDSSSEYS